MLDWFRSFFKPRRILWGELLIPTIRARMLVCCHGDRMQLSFLCTDKELKITAAYHIRSVIISKEMWENEDYDTIRELFVQLGSNCSPL